MALGRFEAGLCACGFHESLTGDKSNHFAFETRVCPVCAGGSKLARIYEASDKAFRERLGDNPSPATPDPSDGRHVFTRLQSPAEVEQRRQSSQQKT